MNGVDWVIANTQKEELVQQVEKQFQIDQILQHEQSSPSMFSRGRHRAFIKVQDGCRYRCSYCVVTLARGKERSRPVPDVISEINHLHANGVQEIVLTGVHLGGYGADLESNLGRLIDAVLADTPIPRIRVGSLEPWDLPQDFWRRFANPRLMPHLHLPVQSGSDSVLRRMSRRCHTADFRALVAQARAAVPDINITTDIIVGFPGETAKEWQETLAFVEAVHFGHIHIFAYSPRAGTKAANLPDPITRGVKRERSEQRIP